MRFYVDSASVLGSRADQQDRTCVAHTFGILCDGMGGHEGGALAAETVLESVADALSAAGPHPTKQLLALACARVIEETRHIRGPRPGTTLVYWNLIGENVFKIIHVGDSRAYKLDRGSTVLEQLTSDHNLAQALRDSGKLDHEFDASASSILLASIPQMEGTYGDVNVKLEIGDWILLASDGFYEAMEKFPGRVPARLNTQRFGDVVNLMTVAPALLDLYEEYNDNASVCLLRRLE